MTLAPLFVAAAAMNAAMAMATTVASVTAADRLGMGWGAVPSTAGIVGTAAGAVGLGRVMQLRGRRAGLVAGYATALVGAVLTLSSAADQRVLGIVAGLLLLGLGNAAAQLSRYVAAELVPSGSAGRAVGAMVWSGTVGAVGGPLLLGPAAEAAGRRGMAAEDGPLALVLACCVLSYVVLLAGVRRRGPVGRARTEATRILGRATLTPLAVMATGQVVMVLVMTAMPVQMHAHGQALGTIGAVLSAHTFGMFALSPLTGWLIDRAGTGRVMWLGLGTLGVSVLLGAVEADGAWQAVALFLLGYGWNLCFVGGSAAVARTATGADAAAVEGAVDAGVWVAAAVASLSSTLLLAALGMAGLSGVGAVLLLPAVVLLARGQERSGRPEREDAVPDAGRVA